MLILTFLTEFIRLPLTITEIINQQNKYYAVTKSNKKKS